MEKKQTLNNVLLAGVLVDKDLKITEDLTGKTKEGVEYNYNAISGKIILRTNDGSEIEVNTYSKDKKSDGVGENGIYKALCTVMDDYVSLKDLDSNYSVADEEKMKEYLGQVDYVKIGAGSFDVNDYKSKQDGTIKTINKIKANFFNKLSNQDKEYTKLESKFEIEGVIDKITDITKKDGTLTGDKQVILNILGYQGTIIPVKLTLPQALVQPFMSMGYYEGVATTLWGKIINTKKEETITEQAGFGASNERVVTTTIRRYEITGGKPPVALETLQGWTQPDYQDALAKRKLKLDSLLVENNNSNGQTQPNTSQNNPFAQQGQANTYNPFAQQ